MTSGQVGTSFLVFIDDYFAMKRDRDPAIDQPIAELPRFAGQDRMAIVAFAGRQLEVLSGWSSDLDHLRHALEAAKRRPAKGLQQEVFVRSPVKSPITAGESRYRALRMRDAMRRVVPPTWARKLWRSFWSGLLATASVSSSGRSHGISRWHFSRSTTWKSTR